MTIPTYQDLMLPLLRVLSTAETDIHQKECTRRVSETLNLTEEQREARLPSGLQTYVHNRIGWAGWYMQQAGLVMKPKKGFLRITDEGRALLAKNPAVIDNNLLATYPSYQEKVIKRQESDSPVSSQTAAASELTPTDQIEEAHQKLNQTLATELRDLMAKMDPFKFEQLVVDLLFAMGYGGSREEAALVTKKSGDEGIDGIINEDRLGLDVVYIQAKRWQASVGRAEIQSFVGALVGKHAHKGVFITTSDFHKTAIEYARGVQHRVVLINGQRLAELMIEHGVGVSTVRTIAIKRVDSDYFED
ncbi:MAG TPA: restriction endonuclease [Prosthecobacter sp.]